MRILKKEVHGLHEDEPESSPPGAQVAAQAPAEITVGASGEQPTQRVQIDALQQQIRDLQRAAAMDAAPTTPAQPRPLVRPGSPSSRAWRTAGLRS
jgi:hypothetical protein